MRFDRRLLAGPAARRGVLIAAACGAAQSLCIVAGAVALATVIAGVFQAHQPLGGVAPALLVFAGAVLLRAALIWFGEARRSYGRCFGHREPASTGAVRSGCARTGRARSDPQR